MMGRVIAAAALFTILTGSPAMFGEQLDAAESDGALEQAQPAASPAATASQDQSAASSRTNQPASGSKRLLDVGQDYVADLFRVRRGVAPKIGTAGPGSGLAFGAELVERRFFETSLFVAGSALYSYRGYALYNLRIGSSRESPRFDLPPADARASSLFDYTRRSQPGGMIYADMTYRHFPQMDFFTPAGSSSRAVTESDFLMQGGSYDLVGAYQMNESFGFSARAGVLDVNVGRGTDEQVPNRQDVVASSTVPGLIDQPAFYHVGAGAAFDTRERPGNPDSGTLLGVAFTRYEDRGSHGLSFTRLVADARTYVPVQVMPGTVALRMLAASDRADRGGRVPFYLQQTLGGGVTLRGFDNFRFRDDNLLHFSAEYRLLLKRWLQAAVFYDTGQVFSSRYPLAFTNFESSWGVGARFTSKNSVKFRVDWATGREGHRFVLAAGPVF